MLFIDITTNFQHTLYDYFLRYSIDVWCPMKDENHKYPIFFS